MENENRPHGMNMYPNNFASFIRIYTNLMNAIRNLHTAVQYSNTTPLDTTKQFIKLEQSFKQQLENHPEFFEGQKHYLLIEKMKISADALLTCQPDKISLQVTDEGSIYYTILKNDITIYFQHYLIDEFDGNDEAIVTIYKGEKNLLNYGGSLPETIGQLGIVLSEFAIDLPVFA
jgi:hypothetical protein